MLTFCTHTSAIIAKSGADTGQGEEAAKGGRGDGFEGLATRGRGCQGFGQFVKSARFHFRLFLS
jgi:hypothetical protein